ncbi:MAG: hypothetical protein LBT36_00385 [Oscillospiraceae bacterium]|jgi:hypothetical protein|nr:hypothetical protein [Oscillospiraceae bacterium]
MTKAVTAATVWREYERGAAYKERIDLFKTVRNNENFFIGKQWEGVRAQGLPQPVFNFLKRVVLFTVAGLVSSSAKIMVSDSDDAPEGCAAAINREMDKLFESNKLHALIQEFLRNAAVDGDGCMYSYWDAERGVTTEVIENTRVFFGNANERRVERQPYIILLTRTLAENVRARLKPADAPMPHAEDGKVTVLLRLWKNAETGTVWCVETVKGAVLRAPWDTGLTLYPLIWLPWDYVQDSYHGQAMITGLIPNQIFINKLFAMSMLSLMTTAYPRIVYDRSRVSQWDNRVGAAIGIYGGDVQGAVKILDPAHISPQIAQFIEMAIAHTQTFLGATPAALGDVRPDNTSAIIALQKAASVPNELTRQNLYQTLEDLGRIYIDFMRVCYGARRSGGEVFDFGSLAETQPTDSAAANASQARRAVASISLRLDVGASGYWSEIAGMQTLDNLLARGKIDFEDYLKRVPDGYIPEKRELLEKLRASEAVAFAKAP